MCFGLILVLTALISWLAGTWLPTWGWRSIVLAWGLLFVDLVLVRIGADGSMSSWPHSSVLLSLVFMFLSGEIGVATILSLLGVFRLGARIILAILVAAPAIVALFWVRSLLTLHFHEQIWVAVSIVYILAVGAYSLSLRCLGYQILGPEPRIMKGKQFQFSIGELLILTTFAAILSFIGTSMPAYWPYGLGAKQWLLVVSSGITLSVLSMTALWGLLGVRGCGGCKAKLATFAVLCVASATSLFLLDMNRLYPRPRQLRDSVAATLHWSIAWALVGALGASFLVALSLVLRTTGFRLVRTCMRRRSDGRH